MKNKILTLNNDKELMVIDEINYLNKRYIFGVYCDNKSETLSDDYLVLEAKIVDRKLTLDNIDDFAIKSSVNNLFLTRLQNI